MKNSWKTVKSKRIFRFRSFLTVRMDDLVKPDGKPARYVVVERPDFVGVVPETKQGKLLLVRQWRQPLKRELWEFPMGQIDKGETPPKAAKRELEEETGRRAGKLVKLGCCATAPGLTNNHAHFFWASDLAEGQLNREGMEVGMEMAEFSRDEVAALAQKNATCAYTLTALWYYDNWKKRQ